MSTEATLCSILHSVQRKDREPPPVIAKLGWRYRHIGIPTNTPRPNEKHLEAFALHVSGFSTSAFGIEWMRYSPDSPLHPPSSPSRTSHSKSTISMRRSRVKRSSIHPAPRPMASGRPRSSSTEHPWSSSASVETTALALEQRSKSTGAV
jgi:hypothetical protein